MIKLCNGSELDFEQYYEMKCEKSSIVYGGFSAKPDKENLRKHYIELIASDGNKTGKWFYALKDDDCFVGYLQLTRKNKIEMNIGYGVSEKFRGGGMEHLQSPRQLIFVNK